MQLPLPVVMTMEAALVHKVARQARIEQAKQRVLADTKGNRSSLSTEGWNKAKRESYQNHQNAWLGELNRMRAEVRSHSLSGEHTFVQLDLLDALHSYHSAYPAAFG